MNATEHARALRIRVIAWLVVLATGGTSGTMSVYHAFRAGGLPWGLAVLAGAVPVVVAMGMSEIVALYEAGWFLKTLTFLVMGGGLAMTMHASADVVGAAQGTGFRWGFGLVLDVAAMIALYVLLNPGPRRAAKSAGVVRKSAGERARAAAVRAVEAYEPSGPARLAPPMAPEGQGDMAPPVAPAAGGAMAHGPSGATGHGPGATLDDGAENEVTAGSAESAGSFAERAKEHEDARNRYRESVLSGEKLSDRALAREFGHTRNWGAKRIEEAGNEDHLAQAR